MSARSVIRRAGPRRRCACRGTRRHLPCLRRDARTVAMRLAVSAISGASIARFATARSSDLHSACAPGPAFSSRPSTSSTRASSSSGNREIVQQTDTECFCRAEPLRGQEQASRRPRADRLDHVRADRCRNEPEPRLRQCEDRVLRADRDIATGDRCRHPRHRRRRGHARPSVWEARSGSSSIVGQRLASARFCAREKPAIFFIQFRSAPAQKLGPAPMSTTARTAGSSPSLRSAAVSSAISVALNALWTSGRLSVTTADRRRPPRQSIVAYVGASHVGFAAAGLAHDRCLAHYTYIRNTPKVVGSIGLFSAAEIASPSTRRVSAGSMTPSSHSRALA